MKASLDSDSYIDLLKRICENNLRHYDDVCKNFWVNRHRGSYKITFYLDPDNPDHSSSMRLPKDTLEVNGYFRINLMVDNFISKELPPLPPIVELYHDE